MPFGHIVAEILGRQHHAAHPQYLDTKCYRCDGKKRIKGKTCPDCKGKGRRKLRVNLC